jgi:hypothetical protein
VRGTEGIALGRNVTDYVCDHLYADSPEVEVEVADIVIDYEHEQDKGVQSKIENRKSEMLWERCNRLREVFRRSRDAVISRGLKRQPAWTASL